MSSSPFSRLASSPPSIFFLSSPSSDAGDSSYDESDTLVKTPPPYNHHEGHRPSLFQQHNAQFTHHFPSNFLELPHQCINKDGGSKRSPERPLSPLSPVFIPSHLSERGTPQCQPFSHLKTPTRALDLADASLELDPFAASFSAAYDANHSHEIPSLSLQSEGSSPSIPLLHPDALLRSRPTLHRLASEYVPSRRARIYSPRFPADHFLNSDFIRAYQPEDELGSGGYGFVMTASHRIHGYEVAVKFIIKEKVPDYAWMEDEVLGRVPSEVMVLSLINHEGIVRCMDVFEDSLYFYLLQELHGTPWIARPRRKGLTKQESAPGKLVMPPSSPQPGLSPSESSSTVDSLVNTPPPSSLDLHPIETSAEEMDAFYHDGNCDTGTSVTSVDTMSPYESPAPAPQFLGVTRPHFSRRASHDLFECIEQSKHKRLSETQARYIFAQVVEAVSYLDRRGITHRDIKDENLVIDKDFKVKLIDFGSAVAVNPSKSRPYYNLFYGTTAYASSEILQRKPYQAGPAEIWTLGVLLSYLLTGSSPFPTEKDAIDGRIVLAGTNEEKCGRVRVSEGCLTLMRRCLVKDPERRANIEEVRSHWWVRGAWEAWEGRCGGR